MAAGIIVWVIWAFNIPVPRLPSVSLKSGGNTSTPAKKVKRIQLEDDEEDEEEEEEEDIPVITKK